MLSVASTFYSVQTTYALLFPSFLYTHKYAHTSHQSIDLCTSIFRYPFLLVDRVVEFEAGKRAVGIKCVTANEPQFTGHFPDRPIMPGVLMVEAMAQVGGIAMMDPDDPKENFFFGGIDKCKFRKPVTPGDTLMIRATLKKMNKRFGVAKFL